MSRPAHRRTSTLVRIAVHALGAFAATGVGAATFVVDDETDATDAVPGDAVCATADGACSLRAAVMEANAFPGADEILVPAGTYPLDLVEVFEAGQLDEAGDLDLLDDVVLSGAGAHVTIVEARDVVSVLGSAPGERLFEVHAGVDATIEGVTIQGGRYMWTEQIYPGAGIANAGTLRLFDSVVRDNLVWPADGGGIVNWDGATLVVRRSTITGNSGDDCGGIDNRGTALLENVTMSGNSGYYGGGACSFTGTGPAQLMILSSTIVRNRSDGGGGPIGGAAIAGSSVFADNSGYCPFPEDPCYADCGLTQSLGKNLVESDCFGVAWYASDLHGTNGAPLDAKLGLLASSGSMTPTHALLPGSPAIDHVVAGGECAATDQRGVARPQDGDGDGIARCDIGAFEVNRPCENGLDDDGDGYVDFPADPGCSAATGTTEVGQCENGRDDDGDGRIDHDGGAAYNGGVPFAPVDPQCAGKPFRKQEAASCGLGAEVTVALALWRARRRRTAGR